MANWLVFATFIAAALSVSNKTSAATLTVTELTPNNLVITEYMANPIGIADTEGEYIELFNTTNDSINLDGLIVRDQGSNAFTVSTLLIAPHSFAVLANADGSALGFTPDFIYGSSMALTNSDDEIGLYRPDGTAINAVTWDDGDFFAAGVAHELGMLDSATPPLLNGPAAGLDYIAATAPLLLDNFGSPGFAGNTDINLATVPIPASVWMFTSALSLLGLARRRACRRAARE